MHIVHVITRLIVGGAQENTLLSCEGQQRAGHRVTLITGPSLGPEGSLMDRALAGGYEVVVVDSLRREVHPVKDVQCLQALGRLYRQLRPDVIHTHSSKAGILGRLAAEHVGIGAVVHTIHGLAFTASSRAWVNAVYRAAERLVAPMTDRIVSVADEMTRQSLSAGVGRARQYVTVYSGMEIEPFIRPPVAREVVRERLGFGRDDVAVGTIARLFDMKGHDDLLELAPRLCAAQRGLKFLWVGDGSLRGRLERRIDELGLRDRFVLTGLVAPDRVAELAGAMDVLVHPSRREGLARALPQAQLAGCPVVCYDIDGNREGLIDGRTGFLVRPFDVSALGERLGLLVADAPRRVAMGQAGRTFAAGRFGADVMVRSLERVYREAIDASLARGRRVGG